jgi:hypothetical protein
MARVSSGINLIPPFIFCAYFQWSVSYLIFAAPHSINNNSIGNEGAAAIGEALRHNKTLTVLG